MEGSRWLDKKGACGVELTKHQKKALILIGCGVRGYANGFYSEDDPGVRLDLRSAEALGRRGLINWRTTGGATMYTMLDLTENGKVVFDDLEKNEWQLFHEF